MKYVDLSFEFSFDLSCMDPGNGAKNIWLSPVNASLRGNVPKHGHVLSPTLDNSRSLREVYREHEHFCQIACRFWRRPECSSQFSDWQDTPRVDEDSEGRIY